MLKPVHSLFLIFLFFSSASYAQGWVWGRGSNVNANGSEEGGPVAIDNSGNIYGINAVSTMLFGPGIITSNYGPYHVTDSLDYAQSVVYSLDDSGNYRWAVGTFGNIQLHDIATDDAGNVYISGIKSTSSGYFAGFYLAGTVVQEFIVKLNSSGNGVWLKYLPAGVLLSNMAVSHTGAVYFTGYISFSPITFGSTTIASNQGADAVVGKYDSSGNQLWAKTFGGDSTDFGSCITITANEVIYLSGTSSSSSLRIGHDTLYNPSGTEFFFVCRMDTSRNLIWGKSIFHAPTGGRIYGISADYRDNLYCSGGYFNWMFSGTDSLPAVSTTKSRMFLFRFDSSGNVKWGRSITDTLLFSASSIGADDCSNIWVSGQGGHFTNPLYDQMYLARFDTSGNLKDTLFLISGGDDANWLKLDKRGYLYVSGDYEQSPFVFGIDTLANVHSNEYLFVAKYIYELPECILDTIPLNHTKTYAGNIINPAIDLTLYPNPTTNEFTIHSETPFPAASNAELYDLTGRLINTYILSTNNAEISVANIPPGMYQCRIYSGVNNPVTKKLVIMK